MDQTGSGTLTSYVFEFGPMLERLEAPVADTTLAKSITREIAAEVILGIHPDLLTGVNMLSSAMSRAMERDADVVALDEFGRLHVVELKQGKLKEEDVEQAQTYLMHLAAVARHAIFDARGQQELVARRLMAGAAIGGLLSRDNLTKIGWEAFDRRRPQLALGFERQFGRRFDVEREYEKLGLHDKLQFKTMVALSMAREQPSGSAPQFVAEIEPVVLQSRLAQLIPEDDSQDIGNLHSPLHRPVRSDLPKAEPTAVLWVGGTTASFKPAREKCRLLCERGVDARPFALTVTPRVRGIQLAGWKVELVVESDVQRLRALEARCSNELSGDLATGCRELAFSFSYYVEKRPSERKSNDSKPCIGEFRPDPHITVRRPGKKDLKINA